MQRKQTEDTEGKGGARRGEEIAMKNPIIDKTFITPHEGSNETSGPHPRGREKGAEPQGHVLR